MARQPLYLTVAESLLRRIESGDWNPGDRLPNEQELAKELFVSRVTLREAMGVLERDGVITRKHGLGSFVERKPVHITAELNKLEPFASGIQRAGFKVTEEILSLAPAAIPPELAASLLVPPRSPGHRLEMIRRMEKVPIIYSRDYILPDVIDPAEFAELGRNILDYLSDTGRPVVDRSYMTVKAVLPDAHEQQVLQCDPLEPLVRLDGIAYSGDGKPVYATSFLIRSRHYELTLVRH